MGRPRLSATSVEPQAAWRHRQGMAVRPHYPSAAAKQAVYRARKQAAQALAARACAAIQQALQRLAHGKTTRAAHVGAPSDTDAACARRDVPMPSPTDP